MKKLLNFHNLILAVNALLILTVFVLNYFYQSNGFTFALKCACSVGFALVGLVNLLYAYMCKQKDIGFYITMAVGLVLAMLGDVAINYDFIAGAAVFALGHVCFVIAYCLLSKIKWLDVVISAVIFIGAAAFLLLYPALDFGSEIIKWVCVAYALIISSMLGKAVSDFIRERNAFFALLAIGSLLFFFSDLMLVLDQFIGIWSWTSNACMATYYPALCILAFAMCFRVRKAAKRN